MNFITLENKRAATLIKDVILYPLKVNRDNSGILVETLRSDWQGIYGKDREFAMQYFSVTPTGQARDEDVWHYHPSQEDRFLLTQGAIVVAISDQRKDSSTFGVLNLFSMEAYKNPYILLIPKKTLHGFLATSKEPVILLNFPTALYHPKEEGRVPYSEVKVRLPNGVLFSWDKVREELQKL